jgi:hypothetical protein
MSVSRIRRVGLRLTEPLCRTAWSLVVSTVLSSLLGVGFWAAAAHIYSMHTLGLDSALASSTMTISMIRQLNLSNVILRFPPQGLILIIAPIDPEVVQ